VMSLSAVVSLLGLVAALGALHPTRDALITGSAIQPESDEETSLPPVHITVMTLGSDERMATVKSNLKVEPNLTVFQAVSGYNKTATAIALLTTGVAYHRLCGQPAGVARALDEEDHVPRAYESWGTLANDLTRMQVIQQQIQRSLPFAAVVEDDMSLQSGFSTFLSKVAKRTWLADGDGDASASKVDYVHLGPFGEGYLLSLEGAKRLLQAYKVHGITGCPDQQLMDGFMPELHSIGVSEADEGQTPWTPLSTTNSGDCLKTAMISRSEKTLLQNLHSADKSAREAAHEAVDRLGYEKLAHARARLRVY